MSEVFLCLKEMAPYWQNLNINPYPHQIRTLEKVVNELGGRALLADEVGLGKTFEAGMIIKEYILRGLANKILILTPSSLVNQWHNELKSKFLIDAYVNYHHGCWSYSEFTIASIDTAKRNKNAADILALNYDMVIVDEAHKLKNAKTQNYQLIKNINSKFLLLLTATPIQNDLKELYNLITLLRPEILGTYRSFKNKYIKDKCSPKNTDLLRLQLQQVMVRNNRKNINMDLPARHVELYPLNLSSMEQDFYNSVTAMVRQEYLRRLFEKQSILSLITLQREICSSTFAAKETLGKMKSDQNVSDKFAEKLEQLYLMALNIKHNQKYQIVKSILENILNDTNNKVIVFTEYLATQEYICQRLNDDGYAIIKFNGKLGAYEKHQVISEFANNKQVLVSTESGGEGLNLQFCSTIINYDLPWNPMRVEQRIGRVHRLGQKKPVQIYNLCTKNTIEEFILNLLHKKINMFEQVIGGLELILHQIESSKSIETQIMDILVNTKSDAEMSERIEQIGNCLQQTVVNYDNVLTTNDPLWGVY